MQPNNSFITASIERIEATKLAGWKFPKNWDRVCGYTGTGPFVAFYSEKDKLLWMDGHLYGSSADTWLFFKDAAAYIHQWVGMAVQASGSEIRYSFGSLFPKVAAVFCLIIARKDYSVCVAPISKQEISAAISGAACGSILRLSPGILTQPCFDRTHGWRLDVNCIIPILDN